MTKLLLAVVFSVLFLVPLGAQNAFAETLIAASGEGDPAEFSKVNIGTGEETRFLGDSGFEFSGIDFSPDGKLYAASSGHGVGGLYDLSVTIASGSSAATPTLVGLDTTLQCSDISFSPSGKLYCMMNNFNAAGLERGLYAVDVDSGVPTRVGVDTGLGRTSGNGLAVNSAGVIYFGNDDGLYKLDPGTGVAILVGLWHTTDPEFDNCNGKVNAMDFDSSDTLYASFQCGFDPYLVTIDTMSFNSAPVSLVGPLISTARGDLKTDALAFAPFNFDFLVGSTHGTADDVEILTVEPISPNGVLVSTITSANVDLCENSSLAIGIGDSFTAECGSVTIQVESGTVVAEFYADDGSIARSTLNDGDNVTFDEVLFSITNNGPDVVKITVDGGPERDILPGETCDANCMTIPPSCGAGTHLNENTNQCDPDVTQSQLDDALAEADGILQTLFEFLRVFGVI